jgi:hypothetical protein
MKPAALHVRRIIAPIGAPYAVALLPADDATAEAFAKLPLAETIPIKLMRARSLPQNRLYWAILQHVAEATEWESAETLHEVLKVRLGLFSTGKTPAGKLVCIPKSTAFDAMDADEFRAYFDRAVAVICREILGGYDQRRLVREVEAMLGIPQDPPVVTQNATGGGRPGALQQTANPGAGAAITHGGNDG